MDLSYFVKFFTKKYYWGTLVNSFKVTITSTLVAVLIGLPMAYLLRNVKIPGSGLFEHPHCNLLFVASFYRGLCMDSAAGTQWVYHAHFKCSLSHEFFRYLWICWNRIGFFSAIFSVDLHVCFRRYEKLGQLFERSGRELRLQCISEGDEGYFPTNYAVSSGWHAACLYACLFRFWHPR